MYTFLAILQACYAYHTDFCLRLPCRVMIAYISVACLIGNHGASKNVRLWRKRLHHLSRTTLQSFSSMMQRQFAVHAQFALVALFHINANMTGHGQWLANKNFYVGSTTDGIHSRQGAKWRQYRCLPQGRFVYVELVMLFLLPEIFYMTLL